MTRLESKGAQNSSMTQLVLEVTPCPKRKRVSYPKPCYDTALGIKSQVIVCTKGPNSNKVALPTKKNKLSIEPQLLIPGKTSPEENNCFFIIRQFSKNYISCSFMYLRALVCLSQVWCTNLLPTLTLSSMTS